MSEEFGVDLDEMMVRYEGCSGNKKLLRKHLEGGYTPWTEQETAILRNKDELGMKMLLESRGQEDVDQRLKFVESED